MIWLTPTTLTKILPKCEHPEKWCRPLNHAMFTYKINTPRRVAAFLAQLAVESAELNKLEENLSYAPGRLTAVWPKRFPDADKARPYSRNPEKLANAVYANRLGNGDEASRDGYRFRGRGLIQVTGRANYKLIGTELDVDLINMPDTLLEPRYAALSAAAFWELNSLNKYADDGHINDLSRKVNGGDHGLAERRGFYNKALEILNAGYVSGGSEGGSDRKGNTSVRQEAKVAAAQSQDWFG